jgi:uncharacterized protein YdhG (YjbR/CyaY superfamily)
VEDRRWLASRLPTGTHRRREPVAFAFTEFPAMAYTSHEDCFSAQTAEARQRLVQIQQEVEARLPDAVRTIAYNMPAFRQRRVFFYFAAFKQHIGVYPPVTDDPALIAETQVFRGPKGNLSFPHAQALPVALIGRIAVALSKQYAHADR